MREPNIKPTRNWVKHLIWDIEESELRLDIAGLNFEARSYIKGEMNAKLNINPTISIYKLMSVNEYDSIEEESKAASNIWDLYISDNTHLVAKEMFKGMVERVLNNRI